MADCPFTKILHLGKLPNFEILIRPLSVGKSRLNFIAKVDGGIRSF